MKSNRGLIGRRLGVQHALALAGTAMLMLALSACGGSDAAAPTTSASIGAAPEVAYGLVSPETAAALAADPDIELIDVRTPAEFAEGHLDRATLIDYNAADFAAKVDELDPSATYLVYCRSGNRSAGATATMRSAGIAQIYELDGGIVAWTDAGLDVVTPD